MPNNLTSRGFTAVAADIPGTGSAHLGAPGTMRSYGNFSSPTGVSMRDLQGKFTTGGWGFQWIGLQGVMDLPQEFGDHLLDNIRTNVRELEQEILDYAQENAPWQDQTGDARRLLHTTSDEDSSGRFIINLGHGVSYGYFLETHNGGEYAIVEPTMQHFADKLAELPDEDFR